jgi:hypothetical protein
MTKSLQEIQEFNRKKIICAVNGTENYDEALKKELGVGCLVEVYMPARNYIIPEYKQLHIINEFNKFEDKFVYEDVDCKNIRVVMEGKMVCDKDKIIGKPLTLDRVLLTLNFYNIGFIASSSDRILLTITIGKIYNNLAVFDKKNWNLTKTTLEEQSEETQRAIYELLGGENE